MYTNKTSIKTCTECVHGEPINILYNSPVKCIPQRKQHHATYCCTAFREITQEEIRERSDAQFGQPI